MPLKKKNFKDFEPKALHKELTKKLKGCTVEMYHNQFIFFNPNNPQLIEKKNLKGNFARRNKLDYTFSSNLRAMRRDDEVTNKAREKLQKNDINEIQKYENDDASLKMHISLNSIGNMDQKLVIELLNLIANEAAAPNNQLRLKFKIIRPEILKEPVNAERFSMNDQITVYFDKYSSTASILNLANKVDEFLKKNNIPENTKKTGLKDKISLNSFVSLRFDNNKLDQVYGEYPFFDLEIQKFLSRHQSSELKDLPMFAFEKIFIDLMLSQSINNFRAGPDGEQALNEEDSKKLQQRFDMALKDPNILLMQNSENRATSQPVSVTVPTVANTTPTQAPPSAPARDFRADPLLRMLPQPVKPAPSNTKISKMIAQLKANSSDHNKEISALFNSVINELDALTKSEISAAESESRAENIVKKAINKAIVTAGGIEAIEILNGILQTLSKQTPKKPESQVTSSRGTDYRKDPLLKILPAAKQTETSSNTKLTELIAVLKSNSADATNRVKDLLNSVIEELEGLSKEKISASDKDVRTEQIIKNA